MTNYIPNHYKLLKTFSPYFKKQKKNTSLTCWSKNQTFKQHVLDKSRHIALNTTLLCFCVLRTHFAAVSSLTLRSRVLKTVQIRKKT